MENIFIYILVENFARQLELSVSFAPVWVFASGILYTGCLISQREKLDVVVLMTILMELFGWYFLLYSQLSGAHAHMQHPQKIQNQNRFSPSK